MTQPFDKLKTLLQELFQLDQPDLDFGLFRVMHAKSAEVSQFLDQDLLPQVHAAFAQYRTADKAEIEKELAKAVEKAQELGADPETLPKVKELRAKLASDAVDIGALEREVYDNLFSFFRRYYSEGDFLAKRVYKPGVYAIPYEGEEVTLHWANKDQYYIKTSEYLRDYAFRLRPANEKNPMRVHFRVADAVEGEHGNVKAAEGKERRFKLAAEPSVALENGELVIRFTYAPDGKKQAELNTLAETAILATTDPAVADWIATLGALAPTEKDPARTLLAKHLTGYSDRNTFDYFIHKDLGRFLRRELDFYIKNEVMHLDDVENDSAPRVEQYLSKIKVVRQIAGKIIDFLAQLEDFQKKLWLKKKVVVETSYCIRIGCIPEEFYPEIAANAAQREEWIRLCAIDDNAATLEAPAYSLPLTPEFLKGHPTLMVDTRHLDAAVTDRLLASYSSLDTDTDGVLLHSENFQALRFISQRHHEGVDMVYADPPYNTSEESFVYKNLYRHSSWLAMMTSRAEIVRALLAPSGVLYFAIDDAEVARLTLALDEVLGSSCWLGTVVVQSNPRGRGINSFFATSHDYYLVYARDSNQAKIFDLPLTEDQAASYSQGEAEQSFRLLPFRRSGGLSTPDERPNSEFPLYFSPESKLVSTTESPGTVSIMPVDSSGRRRVWRWSDRDKINQAGARGDFVVRNNDGRYTVLLKDFYKPGRKPKTIWSDSKYDASSHGTNLIQAILGDRSLFSYPKSIYSVEDALRSGLVEDGITVDYFAGSGTTGHAVINLNREDGGRRKFIMVEMGDYFDTVLLPRIKKVTFTPDWKDGKPKRLATPEEAERSPRIVKVLRLESYEDALNNLETTPRTKPQQLLLDSPEAQGAGGLKEEYILRYMLNVEARGSQSLLNVQAFTDPSAYKLKVKRPGSDESREVNVDLLETFNWLLGLTVKHIAAPQTFTAEFERSGEGRLRLKGDRLKQDPAGPWCFRTVTGTMPDDRKALVIWRKLPGNSEEDNLVLDEWFKKQGYSAKDSEFDLIYVNGGNNLENLKTADDRWKVQLIEEDFHRLMFEESA